MKAIVLALGVLGFLSILHANGITTDIPQVDSLVAAFLTAFVG